VWLSWDCENYRERRIQEEKKGKIGVLSGDNNLLKKKLKITVIFRPFAKKGTEGEKKEPKAFPEGEGKNSDECFKASECTPYLASKRERNAEKKEEITKPISKRRGKRRVGNHGRMRHRSDFYYSLSRTKWGGVRGGKGRRCGGELGGGGGGWVGVGGGGVANSFRTEENPSN